MNRLLTLGWLVLALACGGDDGVGGDASVDARERRDTGTEDTGTAEDAGTDTEDAGAEDSGVDAAAPDPCDEPGATERVSCGQCGERVRFCTADEVWEYGPCENEVGECTPGESDVLACGNCGSQASRCTSECMWEVAGECVDEGECSPGERQRTGDGCDAGETRELLCADSCVFEEEMACSADGCDEPGAIEEVPCGRCGTSERFCTASGVWEYGACTDEGVCDPGTSGMLDCGNCGTQTARCNTECEWTASGSCTDEGECAPGSTRVTTDACVAGEERSETCNDTCSYVPGTCMPSRCRDLDILFVIDDSGSMGEEIASVVAAADDFVGALDSYPVEGGGSLRWRVGVTTTSRTLSGLTYPSGGLLQPSECSMPRRWVEDSDTTRESMFECLADVGTSGSASEMPLLMIDWAMSDRVADGTNAGFLRDDAMLGIVVVTDEDDCSTTSSSSCFDLIDEMDTLSTLDTVKGRDLWATFMIAGPGPGSCSSSLGSAQEATRLIEFERLAPDNAELSSICVGNLRTPMLAAIDHFYDTCRAGL